MANRMGYDTGTLHYGPTRTRYKNQGQTVEIQDESFRWGPHMRVDYMEEFDGSAALAIGKMTSRTTGTPTAGAQVANSANGEWGMALAATNEAEYNGLDWADELNIPASRGFVMNARITMPALALTSVQDIVVGVATAYNATLNSQSKYVRFRMSGSNVLLLEGKDGTTTNNATAPSTATTLTAAAVAYLTIDATDIGRIKFFSGSNMIGTLAQSAFAVTDLLQPVIGVRKASGTGVPQLNVDFLRVSYARF